MIDLLVKVKVDLAPLKRLQDFVSRGRGPIRQVFGEWGKIYRSAMRQRFMKLSRGGGEWPPLKPATVRARRHGKNKRDSSASILWDTGTLLKTLNVAFATAAGQYQRLERDRAVVGIAGPEYHPKGPISIGALAAAHHYGVPGRLPARPILVSPSMAVLRRFERAMDIGIAQAIQASERG